MTQNGGPRAASPYAGTADPASAGRDAYWTWCETTAVQAEDETALMRLHTWHIQAVETYLACLKYGRAELAQVWRRNNMTWPQMAHQAEMSPRWIRDIAAMATGDPAKDPRLEPATETSPPAPAPTGAGAQPAETETEA